MVDKSNGPSDIDRLEQEVAKLRDEVQRISSAIPPQNTQGNESPKRNFAQSLADYVNDVSRVLHLAFPLRLRNQFL